MTGAGGYFDDALLGVDGTGEPAAREQYRDALAQDAAPAQEWGGFTLPRLPVAPGGDERAARALVEADELAQERRPAPVPAGEWGRLQPAVAPQPVAPSTWTPDGGGRQQSSGYGQGGVPGWQAPVGYGSAPPGWPASRGPAPARRPQPGTRPAPRTPVRTVGPTEGTRRPTGSPYVVIGVVLALFLLALVLLS